MQTSIVYEFALIAPYLHLLPTNFSSHLLYYLNCSSQNHFVHLCVNIIHRPVTKHTPEWRVTCTGNGMSTKTRARELLRDTGHTWDWSRVSWHVSQVSSVNTVIVCREPRILQSDTGRDYYKQMILSDTAIHTVCKHQLGFHVSYSLAQ